MKRRPPRDVLLVGTRPPPSGGISAHIDDLACWLSEHGVSVRFVEARPGLSREPASFTRLLGALVAARARGDLCHVHTNGHNEGSWRLAELAARLVGDRALVTLHSGYAPGYIRRHRATCRAVCTRYRRVVCVNEHIAAALRDAGVDEARLLVAPAFSAALLPLPLAPAGLDVVRRRHPVLLAATLSDAPEYGARVLFEGYALLHRSIERVGLLLHGPAARKPTLDGFELLDEEAKASVHRYGDLPRAEALGLIRAADVFVRPTFADGDSISVREALALGVRVVASDAAPRPASCHTFTVGDALALADAVQSALAAPPPRRVPANLQDDALASLLLAYRQLGLAPRCDPQEFVHAVVGADDDNPESEPDPPSPSPPDARGHDPSVTDGGEGTLEAPPLVAEAL